MAVLTTLRSYLGEIERRRRFYRTQRIMHGMPMEVLKDIGWPGVAEGIDETCSPNSARCN